MKIFFTLFLIVCASSVFSQCPNVGFESGNTSNWICGSGTFGASNIKGCSPKLGISINYDGNCMNQGGIDGNNNPALPDQNRHTIITAASGTDPNSNNTVNCLAPASMFPTGVNKYSFRLGNAVGAGTNTLAYAEGIKYSFTVDKSNAGLTYMYAAFVREAKPTIHPIKEAPRFEITVTEQKNGGDSVISCGYYQVIAGATAGFKDGVGDAAGIWRYTDWTKVALDLTGYIGKQITIEFKTADCFPSTLSGFTNTNGVIDSTCTYKAGSHSAYAYIDMYCTPIEVISPPVCANQATVQICAPDGYMDYVWSPGPGISGTLNQKCVTINNPKVGDVYTVSMKSIAGGCPTSTTITLSGADFTVKDVDICDGGNPVTLNATPTTLGNYDFKWEPQTGLDKYNAQNPVFTPGTTTTYTITMTDKNAPDCKQVKTLTVTVGTSFTVKTADAEICEGDQATLTATGADTYTWQPGNLTGASVNVSPAVTTTYTVTGKSTTANCKGNPEATATVTVRKKPIVTVTDLTICKGEKAFLMGSISGGTTNGTWIGGNGTFTPDRNTVNATYTPTPAEETAGTVTLTLESEDPAGPCGKDSKTMNIAIVPAVTADAGPDQRICEGAAVQLAAVFGGAATGGSWSGGTGTYAPSGSDPNAVYTPSVADVVAGKVILKFTATNGGNSTCPGGMDDMIITIDKMPTVSAGASQTICVGSPAVLAGSIGGAATIGTWSGGTGTYAPNNTTLTATYLPSPSEIVAGTVTLTLTSNASGKCPAVDSKTTLTIAPLAVIDAGPHQKICIGNPVTLAGTISGSAIAGTWSGGTGTYFPNNNASNAVYTPSKAEEIAGKVVLTFTSNDPPGPCMAVSDTMSITISQMPSAIAGDYKPICAGTDIVLNGTIGGAATTGTWSGGLGMFSPGNTTLNATYKPTAAEIAAGKVILTLTTNSPGLCPIATSEATIFIYPNPIVNFVVDTPKACPPHCVDFFDSTTAGSTNIVKWAWDFGMKDGTPGKTKDPTEICYTKPGFYDVTLTATSDKGCTSTLTKKAYIETYRAPVANFTSNPNPVTLYDPTVHFIDLSSSDVRSWTWNLGDGKIISPGIQNPTHQYAVGTSGIYTVKLYVVNANGCVDSAIHPVEVIPEFTFYIPNAFTPTSSNGINDTFFGKGVGIIEYHLWIFDRWGNMVFNTTDINTGWDGRANNGTDIAQQDVFVWKVQLTDVFQKKHEYIGTVTVVK